MLIFFPKPRDTNRPLFLIIFYKQILYKFKFKRKKTVWSITSPVELNCTFHFQAAFDGGTLQFHFLGEQTHLSSNHQKKFLDDAAVAESQLMKNEVKTLGLVLILEVCSHLRVKVFKSEQVVGHSVDVPVSHNLLQDLVVVRRHGHHVVLQSGWVYF